RRRRRAALTRGRRGRVAVRGELPQRADDVDRRQYERDAAQRNRRARAQAAARTQLRHEEAVLEGAARRPERRLGGRAGVTPKVAIVGSGFAGLAAGVKLKRAGVDSFTIYEKSLEVGGT